MQPALEINRDRDPTTADADHDHARLDQQPQRRELDDRARLRRGHNTPVTRSIRRDRPAPLSGEPLRRHAVVDRADRLGRPRECGIVAIDDHLRQQRRDRPAAERVDQLLIEQVTDHALRLGAQYVERIRGDRLVGVALQRQQTHLRPVAMGHDHLVVGREIGDRSDRGRDVAALRVGVGGLAPPQQGIASERDNDAAHGDHSHSPVARAYSTACSVARRFAACSNTSDCGPSTTSAATSWPRWAGRQCRNTAPGAACPISDCVTW